MAGGIINIEVISNIPTIFIAVLAALSMIYGNVVALQQDDVKRLRLMRGWLGRNIDVRIDANEAWAPAEVAARVAELEPFGITSVEQPVRHEDVSCLAAARQQGQSPAGLGIAACQRLTHPAGSPGDEDQGCLWWRSACDVHSSTPLRKRPLAAHGTLEQQALMVPVVVQRRRLKLLYAHFDPNGQVGLQPVGVGRPT